MGICPFCSSKALGEEFHYLLKCENTTLENTRDTFIKKIYEISSEFRKLNYRELFKYLLCMSDKDIIEVSAKYFHDVCEIYKMFIKSL